jgi:hypothetical protein
MSSRRFLGPLDAAADDRLRDHFVSLPEMRPLFSPESHIVYGSKGVGKTALRRVITELQAASFFATGTIDLESLSFQRIHVELNRLSETTGSNITTLARSIWRNVILMYGLELIRDKISDAEMRRRIDCLLTEEHFTDPDAPNRVLSQVERFFERLGNFGLTSAKPNMALPVVNRPRTVSLDKFPPTEEGAVLMADLCRLLAGLNKPVAICIDGFDSIVERETESRNAVFAGLIDAIYQLSSDRSLAAAFCVKAFLPKELTHEARGLIWDADKYLYNTRFLHWREASLKEFIIKRLTPYVRVPRKPGALFEVIWHEFMPVSVRNPVHNIDEPSFSYIARHTQFRPRQLLYHVQRILDTWDERSDRFRVDGSFIPSVVSASNRDLAEAAANQLEYARPNVSTFLRSFGGSSNTISYGDCFSKIQRIFGSEKAEAREVFDELFDFGVLGIARRENIGKSPTTIKVRFTYAGDAVSRIQPADDDVVAVCPMFHDYCGCTQSAYGAVQPSAV